ncbi:hypothetical protein [uncultured Massilia sp.]|nr:hypothetical protein [uncultured Massilia sp.]
MGSDRSYLVLNNGDDVIDQNDYVIKIVGMGEIALDEAHNVTYTFRAPD